MADLATSDGPGATRPTGPYRVVPAPLPLTIAGMLAALGPQAIRLTLSIGGGEAYLLPSVSARGTLHMHWLIAASLVLDTALAYECVKYSICTGRSFFAATAELAPRNCWPWFWAGTAILTWAWPASVAGAAVAAERLTGLSTPKALQAWGLPSSYVWSAIALLAVLVVYLFSDRTYGFLAKFLTVIMFANVFLVLLITVLAAKPHHYWQVLMGYLGISFLQDGYPAGRLEGTLALALFALPAGRFMWMTFWPIDQGLGMGRYAGQATRPLRPPSRITVEEVPWNTAVPEERRRMRQWVRLSGYGLALWAAVGGVFLVTYLYSVASLAYLQAEVLASGTLPSGAAVPVQMAAVAQGVLGPMAGWLMLLCLALMLFHAQLSVYDTLVGRTTCDAIAATHAGPRRPYRVYYLVAVAAVVAAGLWLVTLGPAFVLWIGAQIASLVYRSIGAGQIWLLSRRRLPVDLRVGVVNTGLLWITVATGFGAVGYWAWTVLPAEACRHAARFCP